MESDHLLACEGLTKKFGGLVAVNDFSFSIEAEEIVGLIGPNGAGKSTFIDMVSGFQPPDFGRIHFRGEDVTGVKPNSMARRGLVRTFQVQRPLLKGTVMDNVMVSALFAGRARTVNEARTAAEQSCEVVGLRDKLYDDSDKLTSQQKQMLQLARAVSSSPRLLLLDELLAGLNPTEIRGMVNLLRSLRNERGMTMVIVEHNMQAISESCDKVVVISQGKRIAEGTPAEIAEDMRVQEEYLGHGRIHS